MKEWEYTYDAVSKEKWISQIETDLRQKSVSSLQKEWWPGEPLNPLVHAEDVADESVRLPDSFFKHPPLITEIIENRNISPAVVNHEIINALQHGAQSIIVRIAGSEEILHEQWFEGVNREMVTLALQPESITKETILHLKKHLPDHTQLRIGCVNTNITFDELIQALAQRQDDLNSFRFVYDFPSSGLWDKHTAQIFSTLFSDLKTWTSHGLSANSFFAQCILHLEADPSFFKHILQTRVLHMIWQNLLSYYGINTVDKGQFYLECHIEQSEGEQPAHFLIRASMSALAASLSGSHGLCIHGDPPEGNASYERNIRNLQHLLHLESGMNKGRDPLAGAYAIDYHTRVWTKSIWERLSLEK